MKNIFCLIALVCLAHTLQAQDYQLIRSGVETFYKDESYSGSFSIKSELRGVRIDSVASRDSGQIIFPAKEVFTLENYRGTDLCPKEMAWIGNEIYVKNNGDHIILNKNGDTVLIKSSARLNEEWLFFIDSTGNKYTAKVIEMDTLTFYGATDSVKSIEISVSDRLENPVNSYWNEKIIKLSKNYGGVQLYNFRKFPEDTGAFTLHSFAQKEDNMYRYTVAEVYDFEVGDEFHIITTESGQTGASVYVNCWTIHRNTLREVIDKYYSNDNDTLFYTFKITRFGEEYNYNYAQGQRDTIIYKTTYDTQMVFYTNLDAFILEDQPFDNTSLPMQNLYERDTLGLTGYGLEDSRYGIVGLRYPLGGHYFYKTDTLSCYSGGCWECTCTTVDKIYLKGIGALSTSVSNNCGRPPYCGLTFCHPCMSLVYYKKKNKEWGSPLIPVSVNEEKEIMDQVLVYPNPSAGIFTIAVPPQKREPVKLRLFDVLGNNIQNEVISQSPYMLDLSGKDAGVYSIQLTVDGYTISKKIILR